MKRHLTHLSKNILQNNSSASLSLSRYLSTKEAIERRNHLFTLEKKRQLENVGRIEKIEVRYKGVPKDCTLIMNKDISTPYDCARHLSEWHAESSALALIDGGVHWDMHRPLSENCTLEFQTYSCPDPQQVNKAFWRTCSFLLGAVATRAFKDNVTVKLHSFPGPDIRSGSFIYDVDLSLPSWAPSPRELTTLSAELVKLCRRGAPLERLAVSEDLAKEMFVENEHKARQIPNIARVNGNVILYRIEDHVDISKGPLVNHAAQLGRLAVAAVHTLAGSGDSEVARLYRFQGVALPAGVVLNHFAFNILIERAKKLNHARSPINPFGDNSETREKVAATA